MALLKGVNSPPGRQAVHLLADYVELMCAASVDGEYSAADFRSSRKLQEEDDSVPVEASAHELLLERDDVDGDPLERLFLPEAGPDTPGDSDGEPPPSAEAKETLGPAEEDDARLVEATEVIQHLSFRAEELDEAYPFELRDDDNLVLKDLNDTRRTYLFLLLASCLSRLQEKTDESAVTKAFELFCVHPLRAHLGPRFESHVFGTAGDSEAARYTGSLWDKLTRLADDLRLKLLASEQEVSENLRGDNGLDLVAWSPTGDEAPGLVIFFGQCASGANWRGKQLEPSQQKWSNVLSFPAPLVHGTFIPLCYRKVDGSWHREYQMAQGVLFDRLRLMLALKESPGDAAGAAGEITDDLVDALLAENLSH